LATLQDSLSLNLLFFLSSSKSDDLVEIDSISPDSVRTIE
jgi:hypothetical protein